MGGLGSAYTGYDWTGMGLVFAVVVSGIITGIGWVVARRKQRRLEALDAELEEQARQRAAEHQAAFEQARRARASESVRADQG